MGSEVVRIELDDERSQLSGTVFDLRERTVDRTSLVAAIRDEDSPYTVECVTPGPVHDRVGIITASMGLNSRTALAAAGRSRGLETQYDDRIDRLAGELDDLTAAIDDEREPPSGPPPTAVARLRERTAELRGQIEALEATGADVTDARARLRETAARRSELETKRIAAEQSRERTRERRDRRERRLRLEDRLANARRDARAALVARLREEYARAVSAIVPEAGEPFEAPAPTAALAVCRVARIRAPVVLAVDHFETVEDGADWLDAPVVRL